LYAWFKGPCDSGPHPGDAERAVGHRRRTKRVGQPKTGGETMVRLRSQEVAEQLISKFRETGDIKRLLSEVSGFGQWFGRYNKYNRQLFENFLVKALHKGSSGETAPRDAIGKLYKWIEERSLNLPDEEDAKHLLFQINGEIRLQGKNGVLGLRIIQ
jgi:hypothetical protein